MAGWCPWPPGGGRIQGTPDWEQRQVVHGNRGQAGVGTGTWVGRRTGGGQEGEASAEEEERKGYSLGREREAAAMGWGSHGVGWSPGGAVTGWSEAGEVRGGEHRRALGRHVGQPGLWLVDVK